MKVPALCCMLAATAAASLEWESREIRFDVHPAQLSETVEFRFSNSGDRPIAINDLSVSCGCLVPQLEKRNYLGGESGRLSVRFDLADRSGPQHKKVLVSTDDGKRTELSLVVDVPRLYRISPIMMKWVPGNQRNPKIAKLTNPNPQPIKLLSATSSHEDVGIELKTVREGFEYHVVVRPSPAAQNVRSVIRIQPEPTSGEMESKILKFYVHAQ